MPNEVVVDTDVLIHCLRGRADARDFLKELAGSNILCCSAITIGEIYSGMKDEERYNTEILLNSLKVISVDRRIAEQAGHYRRTMKGHNLELDDCIIAATCIVAGAPLITGNAKHYPMGDIEKMIIPGKHR